MCELNVHTPQTPVPANRWPRRRRPAHADVSGGPHDCRTSRWLFNLQRRLSRPNLLIIEELGFVHLSRTGAKLLFEVFSQRCERGSILVTTNLPFDEWTQVFGSERLTGALLERLHPPRAHPGDERRELPPQAQPGDRPLPSVRRTGRRITHRQCCPFLLLQRRHSGQFAADSDQTGGTRLLRHSGMFCRRP